MTESWNQIKYENHQQTVYQSELFQSSNSRVNEEVTRNTADSTINHSIRTDS